MELPQLSDIDTSGKKVIVRADLDIPPESFENDLRIQSLIPTLDYLKEKNAQIILIGHRGRPEGKVDESLSLKPFQPFFDKWNATVEENLRFDPGEEKNDAEFAKKLSSLGDIYVNESFAASHREHASIVGLPKLLPHAAGLHFVKEVENLSKILENPKRPVVAIIGGAKKDKLSYLDGVKLFSDKVLIGGRLPEFLGDEMLISVRSQGPQEKVIVGNLTMDKEDITINTIERFEEEIKKAGTIVLAGPMGKYEDEGHKQGTERIFKAVIASEGFKVAGGGDTEKVATALSVIEGFNWVSVGGGAMLEFLTKKTLPGIEALLH